MENAKQLLQTAMRAILMKALGSTAGLVVLLVVLIAVIIAAIASAFTGNDTLEGGGAGFTDNVKQWEDDIANEVEEQDLPEDMTNVLLAILQQESGGKVDGTDGDIFQASESKCGAIGCITDPQESIKQGVKKFKETYKEADGDVKLAVQSYNFGSGFIDYVDKKNDGEYDKETAVAFSKMKMGEVDSSSNYSCVNPEYEDEGACYGDVEYVDHVMKYVDKVEGDDADSGGNTPKDGDLEDYEGKLASPVDSVTVTSEFGKREDPMTGEQGEDHRGMDFDCTEGSTKIHAAADGEVQETEKSDSLGNYVLIKHADGVYTGYAHMNEKLTEDGEVEAGEAVGVCGQTGSADGAHVHFTVQDNPFTDDREDYNPRKFLDLDDKNDN